MIPFTERDLHPSRFHLDQLVDYGRELGTHAPVSAKPEIKEIPGDEKTIDPLHNIQKVHQVSISFIFRMFQVGVRQKYGFHQAVSPFFFSISCPY
jgi:hypothetical protein